MNNLRNSKSILWLALSIFSAGTMAWYVTEIWSSNQPAQFSDLYAPWWAAHELLLHRRNPYSPEIAHEIQTVIYGAPSTPDSPDDPAGIGGGFAYPPYAVLLLWPTVYLSFSQAQKIFLGVSLLATLLSLALWLRILRFRPSPLLWLTIALFTLGSFPALQAMKLQNLSVIAAALIAVALFLLAANHLVVAGIFLAVSTFKPQFTIALVLWLALWTLSDWRRRRSLAWSFLAALLLLILLSEWLVPGWIRDFLNVLHAYRHYTYGHSLLDLWFPPPWGLLVAACLLLSALALSWGQRSRPADSFPLLTVTSFLLAVTLIVIPTLAPHAQLLLLPGFLCLLRSQSSVLLGKVPRLVLASTWALLAWPWISSFALLMAAFRFPAPSLLRLWEIPLYTSPLLPLATSLALGLLLLTPCESGGRESPVRVPSP